MSKTEQMANHEGHEEHEGYGICADFLIFFHACPSEPVLALSYVFWFCLHSN